jgi:hypothetical protein
MRIGTIKKVETVEPEPLVLPSTTPAEPAPVEQPVEEPSEPVPAEP